jgi:acetylornithine deacetylase
MGEVLVRLDALDRSLRADGALHPLLGGGSVHTGTIEGGEGISTYPDRCRLQLERRTLPGENAHLAESEARDLLGELEGSVRARFSREPLETDPSEEIVRLLSVQAGNPEPVGVPFWTDAALLSAAGIPTVVFGPAGDGAHADVEWVDLDSAERCCEILLATTLEFCS